MSAETTSSLPTRVETIDTWDAKREAKAIEGRCSACFYSPRSGRISIWIVVLET